MSLNILLLEDDELTIECFKKLVDKKGWKLVTANNSYDAVLLYQDLALENEFPRVIITDYNLNPEYLKCFLQDKEKHSNCCYFLNMAHELDKKLDVFRREDLYYFVYSEYTREELIQNLNERLDEQLIEKLQLLIKTKTSIDQILNKLTEIEKQEIK